MLHVIHRTKSDYFFQQHERAGLSDGDIIFSL